MLETYSATEDDSPDAPPAKPEAPILRPATESFPHRASKPVQLAVEPIRPAPVPPKAAKPASPLKGFDPVPPRQTEAFLKRLHLTEELLFKYGRAYDYRTMTVRQLDAVLRELEEEKSPRTIAAPAPAAPAPDSRDLREERLREDLRHELQPENAESAAVRPQPQRVAAPAPVAGADPRSLPTPVELEEQPLPGDSESEL